MIHNPSLPDFVSPGDHAALSPRGAALVTAAGTAYPLIDGIADFVAASDAAPAYAGHQDYYRSRADEYDRGNDAMFAMLRCDEAAERNAMIDELRLAPGARVLEIGCGTCRDTVHLLERGASVCAGDLSREMLVIGRQRLGEHGADLARVRLFRADAMRLPFPDGAFDAAFHFGGLNLFPDIAAALAEMARVVRPGGRIVAGDEGVAPWLAATQFADILRNSNPLFAHSAPLDRFPVSARNVSCRWVLGGSFYLLAFDRGAGEPALDLDVTFPGKRGGSHRTRFFGKLEGVSPQLREQIIARAADEGTSVAEWLETTLRAAIPKR